MSCDPTTGETCVHPIDGTVDPLNGDSLSAANLAAMGILDWAAVIFATCIAALAVVGELKVRCVRVLRLFPLLDFSVCTCIVHRSDQASAV